MKQAKRKKSVAGSEPSADVGMTAGASMLPDAEYVDQLLAATPVGQEAAGQEAVAADAASLCLPAQCVLREAVEYRQHLLALLPVNTVTLDVAAVERVDAAFLQTLLAFVRSRPQGSEPVQWLNLNAVFVEAARLLGVQVALTLPAAA